MPELSRFFGIIVRIFVETGTQHHLPHIHVYFQDMAAVYGIEPIRLLSGSLPRRAHRLAEAWIELHQDELMENWRRIEVGEPIQKIAPLR
jgi:hypothetical protein